MGLSSRDDIILVHLEFVKQVVMRLSYKKGYYRFFEKESLISVGNLGLIEAVDTYDASFKQGFTVYAGYKVRWAVMEYVRRFAGRKHYHRPVHISYEGALEENLMSMSCNGTEQRIMAKDFYRKAMKILTDKQRRAVELYYIYGVKQREIGKMEGCTVQAINVRMANARRRIREMLGD